MKAWGKIRLNKYMMGVVYDSEDYIIEEFRFCLGVFLSGNDRTASRFTPLCDLYEPSAESEEKYISNYGPYSTSYVPYWMELPK